jgi:hypothetical protein
VIKNPNVSNLTTTCNAKPSVHSQGASTASKTFLSRMHHDDVSFTEAIDNYTSPPVRFPRMDNPQDELGEIDIFCGDRAWWKPTMIRSTWNKLVHISDVDDEMMALLQSAIPASAQGLLHGLFNLLDVSLIGYLVGTQEASVFVLVSMLTWLPTTLTYGSFEALAKLIPHTMDHGNRKVAGLYLFIAMASFTFAMISFGLFWTFNMQMIFLRIGFDENAASLAAKYASVQTTIDWISGIGYCLHLLLDVTGHERFSTCSNLIFGLGQNSAVVFQALLGTKSLLYVGLCRALFAAVHVLATIFLAVWWGYLDDYNICIAATPFQVRRDGEL